MARADADTKDEHLDSVPERVVTPDPTSHDFDRDAARAQYRDVLRRLEAIEKARGTTADNSSTTLHDSIKNNGNAAAATAAGHHNTTTGTAHTTTPPAATPPPARTAMVLATPLELQSPPAPHAAAPISRTLSPSHDTAAPAGSLSQPTPSPSPFPSRSTTATATGMAAAAENDNDEWKDAPARKKRPGHRRSMAAAPSLPPAAHAPPHSL